MKKTEEIKKRKKDIIIAINRESTFGNLKEENIISKLKDNYDNIKNNNALYLNKNDKNSINIYNKEDEIKVEENNKEKGLDDKVDSRCCRM